MVFIRELGADKIVQRSVGGESRSVSQETFPAPRITLPRWRSLWLHDGGWGGVEEGGVGKQLRRPGGRHRRSTMPHPASCRKRGGAVKEVRE